MALTLNALYDFQLVLQALHALKNEKLLIITTVAAITDPH